MKKTGYVIFFLSLGLFIPCVIAFAFLLSSFWGMQAQALRADEFLYSEPVHRYVNTASTFFTIELSFSSAVLNTFPTLR